MSTSHTVQQGECLSSIAEQYGFFWETLWQHPANAALKREGRHPNALLPGDVVHIPDKRLKEYTRPTGARHTWRVRGVPVKLRVQILDDDVARANEPFTLDVEGAVVTGTTDGQGFVEATIPSRSTRGVLIVGEGEAETRYELMLGHLDPVESVSGTQARLANLGYRCAVTGTLDDATREAVAAFQAVAGIGVTGDADDATRAKLRELHDTR